MDSPYIASVASALAVPSPALSSDPLPQRFFTPDKTWLAALAFAAGVAVTWFVYDPHPEGEEVVTAATAEVGPDGIRTISVNDLPSVSADGTPDDDLPAIIQTSQLPRARDEAVASDGTDTAVGPSGVTERRAPVQRVQALTPALVKPAAPVRPKPTPASAASPPSRSSCTPPYSIDSQGIQRLKPECLNSAQVITGPYGAVIATSAAAPASTPAKSSAPPKRASPAASQPSAPRDHQARSSATCSPPYYVEGKIRRLKLECL
jgi:hypothetical protein